MDCNYSSNESGASDIEFYGDEMEAATFHMTDCGGDSNSSDTDSDIDTG